MNGGVKAALIIGLMVIALVGFNAYLWRRMREAVEEGKRREAESAGDAPPPGGGSARSASEGEG